MYLNSLAVERFRTFSKATIDFIHADQDFRSLGFERPALPNVNLLLGNNGSGKSAMLMAIALAALGPAVRSSGIYAYRFVRREPGAKTDTPSEAVIGATFTAHEQDHSPVTRIESRVSTRRRGDLEELDWTHSDDKLWHPIFSESSDAFFVVGYGATRRVERKESVDLGSRGGSVFARARRVQSLFQDAYSLVPLNSWLPEFESRNPGRYSQVVTLINSLLGDADYTFKGEQESGEYLFDHGRLKVPFPALSDGYRAFLGWVGDLLYHVSVTCPPGKKLIDNRGIVMVDEIDLHLHPKWQMTILPTLARVLPNIQFIVTSHSPLIVGSLEWMNILLMKAGANQSSEPARVEWAVHGLDADQVLLTDFFGLETTRAEGKSRQLKELTLRARTGDQDAAEALMKEMTRGLEAK